MVTTWTEAVWFLPFVIPIAIWVTWSDMASMKIPNKAVLALMIVFAVIGLIALPFVDYLWRWAHFAVVLVITFVLNALRLLGAGDAKFAAAMAPFIALPDWYPFMFLLGATLIAAFIVHRVAKATRIRQMVPDWESWTRREFPMGMALAPALVFYLAIALAQG
ncbi:A24 family peptidase [Boseongicola aestuarii]|uniref:Type IV leader peptidase family protein n=1 Tax=Boseongicola aestuarii TaxID=1470561 RepID=A0A238IXE7_9RHOB|nr:prepilin peptidase [Boseongicola aestuarii]SMX22721.1 Type IV leader peptidase family protein [Boseongicola aestuarii]